MTEKILIKIDWKDIRKYFPKAIRYGIMRNTNEPQIVIPTSSEYYYFTKLKQCVEEWKASEIKISIVEGGFITYEIVWNNDYQIEVDV